MTHLPPGLRRKKYLFRKYTQSCVEDVIFLISKAWDKFYKQLYQVELRREGSKNVKKQTSFKIVYKQKGVFFVAVLAEKLL